MERAGYRVFRLPQGLAMDGLHEFLATVRQLTPEPGSFLGLLNVLIGRRIENSQGVLISQGLTWRSAAALLKRVRWDKDAVRSLGLDPKALPPRDRERFWYAAISQARLTSPEAMEAGNRLSQALEKLGYRVDRTQL
jgi:hypothetical protein